MSLSLKQLEAFVWVADLSSFRKAAERLNTTQPNISARISSLEQATNVTLMERDAGSVRLTRKGKELLEHARTVLRAVDALVAAADEKTLIDGVLKLGVTELIVNTWLRDFLKQLKEQFPSLDVELTVDLSVNLTEELFSRSIDLAFQNGPFDRQTTGHEDLGSYPTIWVASPALDIHALKVVKITDMLQHSILVHSRGTKSFDDVASHFEQRAAAAARLVPTSNIAPCLHMTIDGLGVSALPIAMVKQELANGALSQLNYEWVPEPLHFFARYQADKTPAFVGRAAQLACRIAADFAGNVKA